LGACAERDQETGVRIVGTRTVEVTIPDVDLANNVDWPEAALLAHFAFGTPNPIASEYEPPQGESEEE
jgi:hypothetical protein